MAYTKHNFKSGEILYAAQMNEIDAQVAESASLIESVSDDITRMSDNIAMKQDKLIAGSGIYISPDGKTISATGGGTGGGVGGVTAESIGAALGYTPADAATVSKLDSDKQDKISDIDSIRAGAARGATALQTAPVTSVNGSTGAVVITHVDSADHADIADDIAESAKDAITETIYSKLMEVKW